jgi:hypothetical protein
MKSLQVSLRFVLAAGILRADRLKMKSLQVSLRCYCA